MIIVSLFALTVAITAVFTVLARVNEPLSHKAAIAALTVLAVHGVIGAIFTRLLP